MNIMSEGGVRLSFLIALESNFLDLKVRQSRGRSSCRERFRLQQRRKLTTNMPDCGRRAPDRQLSSLAMWLQWAGEQFFHFTSFACHTERKCAADVWETVESKTPAWEGFTANMRGGFPNNIRERRGLCK